ncbi:MAG: phosphoribosyl 1,2-cyclic phosphodiesterase/CheY-like chemotaxis protein [Candidatus Binatia bacterium]
MAGPKTILVIDEEQELREALRRWLTEDKWTVLEADNGEEGLALIRKHRPQVVICDLLMRRCNGFRLCRHVHEDPDLEKTVKIIISSSRGYAGDRLNALQSGADEYLVKPFEQDELTNILIRLLEPEKSTFVKLWERFRTTAPAADLGPAADLSPPDETPAPTESTTQAPAPERPAEEGLRVKFWGVRGSTPTPGPTTVHYGGNTSCVEVRADGEIIVLDAGSGIRLLGHSLVREFPNQPINLTLLITHTHWDHIQGFPFFLPAYNPQNNIKIRGFEGSSESLADIFAQQMRTSYFPVTMQQMPAMPAVEELQEMKFKIGKVEVEAAFMNHPGICVGYRLNTSAGSVAFLPDNEPYQRLRGAESDSTGRITDASLAFARKQDQRLIDYIRDVDVLIIDTQYDDSEYQSKVGWGHGCLDDVVTLALMAGVKQLHLFHHDPDHDDDHITRMTQWARDLVTMHGDPLQVEAAREGVEIILQPKAAADSAQA